MDRMPQFYRLMTLQQWFPTSPESLQ